MKKRIMTTVGVILALAVMGITAFTVVYATNSEANIPSDTSMVEVELTEESELETMVTFEEHEAPFVSTPALMAEVHERIETYDIEELTTLIASCEGRMGSATMMAEAARALGYDELNPVIKLAQEEYDNAELDYEYYVGLMETAKWNVRKEEYPVATQVWLYLTDTMGLSERAAAGIMGNLMAEVGGQTLNLQPGLYGHSTNSYYGICQWSASYYPSVQGKNLDYQLEFLANTIEKEFSSYGNLYQSGFTYEDFKQMNNEQDAALAFAKIYERCNSKHYNVRLNNAVEAYEYFVN
jgi:hypothetical protein